jgi:hypothetical protein
MSYLQNENLIDITTIKTVRESLRYYQLHINKKINNIKYKIYDDDKIIDCGEITKKSEIDSHKTNIIFEYDLNKNYFIKIKYTLFGNNNVFSGHKFLLANIVEPEITNIEQKNIKIRIKKDIKKEERLIENTNQIKEEEEESSEEELESSVSSSEVGDTDKESNNELNDDELITKYFENKYKFMNNNYSIQNKNQYYYSNNIDGLTFNQNDDNNDDNNDDDNDNDDNNDNFDFNNI